MNALDELALLLRPAGGGVYLVSTGKSEQEALQRRLYGAKDASEVDAKFRATLARIPSARGFLLGIPSDVGGGLQRGANLGPQAIRTRLLEREPDFPERAEKAGVLDIGDVFAVPQLLHDEMLSPAQIDASRRSIYPGVTEKLPVSALSIAERAFDLVFSLNPKIAPFVLGGDHSCAWPVVAALARSRTDRWGIVQPDAHTDLLQERLGVKYCFGTWSFHANELLGRGGRLVQVGTRASRYDRDHWEKTLDVRQFWAAECRANPGAALDAIVAHLKKAGVTSVYFSNDIDGTDEEFASATGTPEPGGLSPEFVLELIRRLGKDVGMLGGDVMEVAPRVASPAPDHTLNVATQYLVETMRASLGAL